MSEQLKPCLKKIHDLLDAIETISSITLSPNMLADEYSMDFDCNGCLYSKHHLGDLFDEDICLSCWKEAAKVGVLRIGDALRTENEALRTKVAELEKNLPAEYLQNQTGLPKYITKIEAENQRMRELAIMGLESLKTIRDHGGDDMKNIISYIEQTLQGGE